MAEREAQVAARGEGLRELLAIACNILAMEGHTDISLGHASLREPGAAEYWMKASGFGLEEVTADDMVLLDFDGNKLWGDRRQHNETPIHGEIYRVRTDVCAVVHTHPPYATALSATAEPLRPISHEGVLFSPLPRFVQTTDLIITRDQGRGVAEALGPHNAVLLKNHGVVTAAASLEEATLFAIFLERAAIMQSLAASFGRFEWTDPEEAAVKRKRIYSPGHIQNFWGYYRRKLERHRRRPA
ncbi:MAG: class II aldolase/adducin family protein [bacterium]